MRPDTLHAVEQKVFRISINHGWWDIYLGLLLLAIGASALLDDFGKGEYDLWLMLPILILFFVGRRYLIEPRLGKVRYGPQRRASLRIIAGLTGLAVLLGLALWLISAAAMRIPAGSLLPVVLFAVLALGGFGLAAYLLRLPRLYLYGFLYALAFVALELTGIKVIRTLPALAGGLVILTVGLVYLARFLRQTPLPDIPQEETHGR